VTERLTELAEAGKCITPDAVARKVAKDGTCTVTPTKPGEAPLAPEEVYKRALPGVFTLGCVLKPEKAEDDYETGWFATAWALTADGVLVTNWHIFEKAERAYFGAANHKGEVFPVTDILAVNKKADVAVVKVAGKGFAPLPVAAEPAEVGSWVGVLSHPGHQWFTFTQGHVTRYTRNFGGPEARGERWMSVTAEFAGGSSGGPVLNRFGAVVGMACLTSNIDFDGDDPPPDDPKAPRPPEKKPNPDEVPRKKPDEKAPKPPAVVESRVQMIVKLAVPAAQIRKVLAADR
jgi:S1-C subfamily serine protease